jgi:hypothetical protein
VLGSKELFRRGARRGLAHGEHQTVDDVGRGGILAAQQLGLDAQAHGVALSAEEEHLSRIKGVYIQECSHAPAVFVISDAEIEALCASQVEELWDTLVGASHDCIPVSLQTAQTILRHEN